VIPEAAVEAVGRLTQDDLFFRSNDPEDSDYHKGIECLECGAAVVNTERHVEWHNKGAS